MAEKDLFTWADIARFFGTYKVPLMIISGVISVALLVFLCTRGRGKK